MKKKVRREKESQTERSCFEGEQQLAGVSKPQQVEDLGFICWSYFSLVEGKQVK